MKHLHSLLLVLPVFLVGSFADAQDASLLLRAPDSQPGQLTLESSSFMYQHLPADAEQRELRINDIITVLVDYRATMLSEGDAQSRKTANLNAVLADWLKFTGKDLIPAPQSRGDLAINGTLTSQYRSEADIQLRDALTFRIAATIVDIRPNGNLVIEAHREIRNNEEIWKQSLTGIVSRQAIGADRTVRSENVTDLRIDKREHGFVREGYARGWFSRWYGKWKPF